ncbi:FecR family protein [Echinicola salinicaeni]|uniref:FecR family protein n=1 Tax=Echinicola salinicaeni TaxID=2762757 RepID=UPI0016491B0E|nr:FecR family protein [Echinicola salinicaeni]
MSTVEFDHLLAQVLSGEASESEVARLEEYVSQNPEAMEKYRHAERAWKWTGQLDEEMLFLEDDWEKIQNRIQVSGTTRLISRKRQLAVAATLALILALGALFYHLPFGSGENGVQHFITVSSPEGSRSHIVLEDGTEVWLNEGSSLKYGNHFNEDIRQVFLSGEGFFEVTKSKLPFLVTANEVDLKVLGTSFNVRSYEDEEEIETTLLTGKLMLSSNAYEDIKPVLLDPADKVVYQKADPSSGNHRPKITKERLSKDNMLGEASWKDAQFIFDAAQLGDIAKQLERQFNVQVSFQSEELKELRFTGKISNESLEYLMRAIKLSTNVQYSLKDDELFIYR